MQLQTKTSDVSASLGQGTVMRNSGTRNDKAELFQEGHGLGIFVDILLETGEEGRNGLSQITLSITTLHGGIEL